MKTRSSIKGFKECSDLLQKLPDRVQKRVLQNATNAGARVFAKAFKAAVPRDPELHKRRLKDGTVVNYGHWFENIKVRVMKRLRSRTARGAQVWTGNAFWSVFYEFGRAHQPARPIMRSTAAANVDAAAKAERDALVNGIEREALRLAKK